MTIVAAVGEEPPPNQVISIGYDLALAHEEPLSVVHVIPEKEFEAHRESLTQISEFPDLSITQEEDSAAHFAKNMVRETLGKFDSDVVSTIGRVGRPVGEVLSVVDEVDARYLVIGGHRRSPTGKAIFGDRTQSILLNSEKPVMTVMSD